MPRRAIGALPLPVPVKAAKLVMSSATDEQSSPDMPTIRSAMRRLISASYSALTACIASQNRR